MSSRRSVRRSRSRCRPARSWSPGWSWADTDEAFLSYGWRIPFLLSIALVAVGLYMRLSIEETPAFRAAKAHARAVVTSLDRSKRLPFLEAVRVQPREVLLAAGSLAMLLVFFYMGTAYLTSYGTTPNGAAQSRPVVLSTCIAATVLFATATVIAGVLSDRFGRRSVIRIACAAGSI